MSLSPHLVETQRSAKLRLLRTCFGSLLLARPDPEHGWLYVGRVGSGFNDELMREVTRKLAKGGGKKPTAHVGTLDTDLRTATWFAPRFVVEVFFRGIGRQQLLRQPSLKAVRTDKDIGDLADSDRGKPASVPSLAKAAGGTSKVTKKATKTKKGARGLPTLSSPGKILFPDAKITKQEVWDYYLAVADHLLPEIAGRPLSIIRCPAGIERPCFFSSSACAPQT